jgi:hypothetical protein
MNTRRGFLGALAGAAAALTLDPERLLWRPGAKLISIPAVAPEIVSVRFISAWSADQGRMLTWLEASYGFMLRDVVGVVSKTASGRDVESAARKLNLLAVHRAFVSEAAESLDAYHRRSGRALPSSQRVYGSSQRVYG